MNPVGRLRDRGNRHRGDAPASRDAVTRRALRAQRTKRWSAGTIVKFVLAAFSILGIGVGITTAAWSENVVFEGQSSVDAFRMEYSFTNAAPWHPFHGDTITLTQWPAQLTPTGNPVDHYIFVRNIVSPSTRVTVTPELEGVLADAGVVTIRIGLNSDPNRPQWHGGPVDVSITPTSTARIDLHIDPSALTPSEMDRDGTLTLTVTGTQSAQATAGDHAPAGRLSAQIAVGDTRRTRPI